MIASPSAATWVGTETDWEVCPSRAAEGGSSGDDYYWTFGDGLGRVQTSTGWASYTWGAPGSYNVKIHLSSSQSVEAMAYVRQCSSSGSGSSGPYVSALGRAEVGEELVFWLCPGSGSSGDTSGDTYLWDTDDGHQTEALANQVALRYTYQKSGDFRVTVRVNATTASEKSYSIAVNVAAPAPCPLLGIAGPTAVDVLEPVTFTVCGTKVGSASVTWHFGDGTKQTSNGASARHTYTQGGAFTVTAEVAGTTWTLSHVSVADCRSVNLDAGSTIVATASSTIEPQVPVSFALCEGFSVGAVPQQRSYQWLFGDTSQSSPSSAATTIGHTYLQPGTYSVEVRVSSRYDNTSGTVNTTVRGSVTVAAGNSAACPQGSIASNSSITNVSSLVGFQTCGSLPTGQLTWIFGDGAASTTPQHTYKKWALYTVSLQVGEAASPLYQTVQAVLDCPKNLKETRIVVGGEAVADEQVAFALCIGADHAAQFRSLPTPLFQWTLGDGAISRQSPIEQAFVYTYQKTGTYAVVVDIVNTTLQFNTTITVAASASSGNATYDSTAEIIVGIIFSVISGLLFLGGFVYLAYRYFKKRTGTAFSVSRPSTDYFLMRNEDEDEDSDRDSQA